jgi:hypothetical protein
MSVSGQVIQRQVNEEHPMQRVRIRFSGIMHGPLGFGGMGGVRQTPQLDVEVKKYRRQGARRRCSLHLQPESAHHELTSV